MVKSEIRVAPLIHPKAERLRIFDFLQALYFTPVTYTLTL